MSLPHEGNVTRDTFWGFVFYLITFKCRDLINVVFIVGQTYDTKRFTLYMISLCVQWTLVAGRLRPCWDRCTSGSIPSSFDASHNTSPTRRLIRPFSSSKLKSRLPYCYLDLPFLMKIATHNERKSLHILLVWAKEVGVLLWSNIRIAFWQDGRSSHHHQWSC